MYLKITTSLPKINITKLHTLYLIIHHRLHQKLISLLAGAEVKARENRKQTV